LDLQLDVAERVADAQVIIHPNKVVEAVQYAALSCPLMNTRDRVSNGYNEQQDLADLWISYHDIQNYIVLGDPAVKIVSVIDKK
jgi:hypothetical protein